jgi:hypothetical protein
MGIASARRRRHGAGRMDRGGRADHGPLAGRHPPLRRLQRQRHAGCTTASRKRWACTTRCRGRSANSTARGRSAARRCTRTCVTPRRDFRQQNGLGTRPNFFAPSPDTRPDIELRTSASRTGCPGAAPSTARAAKAVALFDMSSFSKYLVKDADARNRAARHRHQRRGCADRHQTVYTAMLNERGGYESDFTLTRLADDQFLLVTGTAQTTRDFRHDRQAPDSGTTNTARSST